MSGIAHDVACAVVRRAGVVGALALLPTALALKLAAPPPGAGAAASGTLLSWLLLPAAAVAATAVLVALERWPLFGRDLEGARLVRRTMWSPLDGCGLATLGALAALLPLLAVTGLLFAGLTAWLVPDAPNPRAYVALVPSGSGSILDRGHQSLALRNHDSAACDLLRLNPIAVSPDGRWSPTDLAVTIDGIPLPTGIVRVSGNRERLELPLASHRRVTDVVLTQAEVSSVALVFPPRSAELRLAGERSFALNLALAALTFAVPALLALAIACLGRRALAAGVQSAATVGAFVLALLLELGPHALSLRACAGGRAVATEPWASALVLPTGLATILFAAAMLPFFIDRRRRASPSHMSA